MDGICQNHVHGGFWYAAMLKLWRLRCSSRNLLSLQSVALHYNGYYTSIPPFLTLKDSEFYLNDVFFGFHVGFSTNVDCIPKQ